MIQAWWPKPKIPVLVKGSLGTGKTLFVRELESWLSNSQSTCSGRGPGFGSQHHVVIHMSIAPVPGAPAPSSDLCRHQHGAHTYVQVKYSGALEKRERT